MEDRCVHAQTERLKTALLVHPMDLMFCSVTASPNKQLKTEDPL